MIIHDVEQGTPEWLRLRLGIPTASEFDKILTPKTLKPSSQARGYAFKLIAEEILGYPVDDLGNLPWIERGKELEPHAAASYEFETEIETRKVGFITTDDGRVGASPDRLSNGGGSAVELKCPAPATHIGYLVDGFGADYILQVQGQMLVGQFEFVDRYSYHPQLPPVLERTHRNETIIRALDVALREFLEMRDQMMSDLKARGFFEEKEDELDRLLKEMA